jgi:hypothetical protein
MGAATTDMKPSERDVITSAELSMTIIEDTPLRESIMGPGGAVPKNRGGRPPLYVLDDRAREEIQRTYDGTTDSARTCSTHLDVPYYKVLEWARELGVHSVQTTPKTTKPRATRAVTSTTPAASPAPARESPGPEVADSMPTDEPDLMQATAPDPEIVTEQVDQVAKADDEEPTAAADTSPAPTQTPRSRRSTRAVGEASANTLARWLKDGDRGAFLYRDYLIWRNAGVGGGTYSVHSRNGAAISRPPLSTLNRDWISWFFSQLSGMSPDQLVGDVFE